MKIDDKKNTPHFFLWGFDNHTGKIFVDARISIKNYDKIEIASIKGIGLRQRYVHLNSALIWLPNDCSFDDIITYVESYNITKDKSILEKLEAAKTSVEDMLLKPTGVNSVDYILSR